MKERNNTLQITNYQREIKYSSFEHLVFDCCLQATRIINRDIGTRLKGMRNFELNANWFTPLGTEPNIIAWRYQSFEPTSFIQKKTSLYTISYSCSIEFKNSWVQKYPPLLPQTHFPTHELSSQAKIVVDRAEIIGKSRNCTWELSPNGLDVS